jgi:ribosomal protein L12E/L44/L45/RPP1/RPP2
MPRYRKLFISVLFLGGLAVVLAWLLYRRASQPPEIARLLPEGDVLVYLNLRPLHLWKSGQSKPAQIEGDYQNFIDQTGIQLERDLDEAAMSRRDTPDGRDTESTEILSGRFDLQRLKSWLEKTSAQRDSYHNRMVYLIPHEGHAVRVCLLDPKRVAVTNMASSDPMHAIIEGTEKVPDGPSLLQSYYRQVALASLGWLIVRTGSERPQLPNGWSFDFLQNTITVASVRYTGDLLLRAEVIASSDNAAKNVVESAAGFLAMYRTVAQSVGAHGTDPDVKAAIDSIQVEQNKNVAVFTATISDKFVKKLVSEAAPAAAAAPAAPSPSPAAAPHRKRHRRHATSSRKPPAG